MTVSDRGGPAEDAALDEEGTDSVLALLGGVGAPLFDFATAVWSGTMATCEHPDDAVPSLVPPNV